MRLNLASGQDYRPGYINIDSKQMYGGQMHVDKVADVFTLEWEDNTVDEILLSHFAMYISLEQMPNLLRRWYKWLNKGGKLIIETGNVKSIAKFILENDDPNLLNGPNGVMQLFGWQTTAGHKWAWCPETLGYLLYEAGFETVEQGEAIFHKNPVRDFLLVATK